MRKKQSPERKKRRIFKRILIYSIFFAGVVGLVGLGTYTLIAFKLNKPLYVSPLASITFVQASEKDSKINILKKELKKKEIEYKDIKKESEAAYVVRLKDNSKVTFSSQKDIISQIASLQYILSHLTMEGKRFSRLDLRFEKPVIVLNQR